MGRFRPRGDRKFVDLIEGSMSSKCKADFGRFSHHFSGGVVDQSAVGEILHIFYHFSGGVIMSLCYGCTNKSYNVANGQFYHQIYRGVMPIKSSQISMENLPSELSGSYAHQIQSFFNGPRVRKNRKKNRVFCNSPIISMGNPK